MWLTNQLDACGQGSTGGDEVVHLRWQMPWPLVHMARTVGCTCLVCLLPGVQAGDQYTGRQGQQASVN